MLAVDLGQKLSTMGDMKDLSLPQLVDLIRKDYPKASPLVLKVLSRVELMDEGKMTAGDLLIMSHVFGFWKNWKTDLSKKLKLEYRRRFVNERSRLDLEYRNDHR